MLKYYQSYTFTAEDLFGQFVFSKRNEDVEGFSHVRAIGDWFLGTSGLPVESVYNSNGRKVGVAVGFLKQINGLNRIEIGEGDGSFDLESGLNGLFDTAFGRYLLIIYGFGEVLLYLDPSASLGAVFSETHPVIASNPNLLSGDHIWNMDLIQAFSIPEKDNWYPFGLTSRIGIRRLLPNHYLKCEKRESVRHWPNNSTCLSELSRTEEAIEAIGAAIEKCLILFSEEGDLYASLTAGRDSRVILSCSRKIIDRIEFITYRGDEENLDSYMARKLSDKFGLKHRFMPVVKAEEDALLSWQFRTGHAMAGGAWKLHKSNDILGSDRGVIVGLCGEVGRCYYWKKGDNEGRQMTVDDFFERTHIPYSEVLVTEAERWIDSLKGYSFYNLLDLLYLENRLGCWASPQLYGDKKVLLKMSPFSNRMIFSNMLRLPSAYKKKEGMARDLCYRAWPEVLELPFNKYDGYRGLRDDVRKFVRKVRRRLKI